MTFSLDASVEDLDPNRDYNQDIEVRYVVGWERSAYDRAIREKRTLR